MSESTLERPASSTPSLLARFLRHTLLKRLAGIEQGRLVITDALGRHEFGSTATCNLEAHIEILQFDAYIDIALGGGLGAGESYIDGAYRCSSLTDLVQIFLRNRTVLDGLDNGWTAAMRKPMLKAFQWLHRNSMRGSRRNIAAHYDLGNELFELFLDPSMMYSCAVYPDAHSDLDTAARHKLDIVCRKLQLQPGDHLLEIGTGWGGLAIHAATHYGCRVTTTTISAEQYALASARVAEAGLEDRIELLLRDYRELEGRYDKIVSIEMIEAVGYAYYNTYFEQCDSLLNPGGSMLLQAITIDDRQYEQAKRNVDFIKRYIFPGGGLPSNTVIASTLAQSSSMRIVDLHDIGADYARTLAHWRARFVERLGEVRALGYDEQFVRMWLFYFCYCEGAFREQATSAVQYLLARPGANIPSRTAS